MKAALIYLAVPHLFNYLSSIRSALALARFLNIIFKSQVSECNIALNFSKKKKNTSNTAVEFHQLILFKRKNISVLSLTVHLTNILQNRGD